MKVIWRQSRLRRREHMRTVVIVLEDQTVEGAIVVVAGSFVFTEKTSRELTTLKLFGTLKGK